MNNQVVIGCDPEVFLLDQNGTPYSAEGIIGGSKWNKNWYDNNEFSLEEDGLSAELGIKPATNAEEFSQRIEKALNKIKSISNLSISLNTTEKFSEAMRNTPQGIESGCLPSLDVYMQQVNEPLNFFDDEYRYSGGHVHIGFGFDNDNEWVEHVDPDKFIKAMDWYVGVPYIKKTGTLGSKVHPYRRLGQWRFKTYGAEYRTMGNEWVFSNESRKEVFERTQEAVQNWDKLTGKQEAELQVYYEAMR